MCLDSFCLSWELRTGVIVTGIIWSIYYFQNIFTSIYLYYFVENEYVTACIKYTNLVFFTAIVLTSIILILAGTMERPQLCWPWLVTIALYWLWIIYPFIRWFSLMTTFDTRASRYTAGGHILLELGATFTYMYFVVLNYAIQNFYWH